MILNTYENPSYDGLKKLRILITTQYFWPENFRINDLVEGLVERGHIVTVLTGLPNYPSGKFYDGYGIFRSPFDSYKGARVIRVPLINRGRSRGLRLALNYFSFALSASILGPILCRGPIDAIFVHEPSPITVGFPAIAMKLFKRAPILFWVLDLWPESLSATGAVRSKNILNAVGRMSKFIYDHCDLVLVQSKGFYSHIEKLGVSRTKLRYFPSWAEELYVPKKPKSAPPEFSKIPASFRILFAGNIGEAQDFPTILTAADLVLQRTRSVHWLIVGSGRKLQWVQDEVQRRGLAGNVHFLGTHPVDRMPDFFSAADCLLVSLKNDPIMGVTIPGKLQSYLACGRPIIASLNGTGAEVVKEAGAGMTAPAENPEALANIALAMASLGAGDLEKMGIAGRNYYLANFDRTKLIYLLESMMKGER